MKLLLASATFHPDFVGIAPYSTDLARYCVEQGHDVTVATGFPFYPSWRKRPEDEGRLFGSEEWEGMRILRSYVFVPRRVTNIGRVLHDLSFAASSIVSFFRSGRTDRIIVFSPPLVLGLIAMVFKWLWRAEMAYHVQDFQVGAAESLRMLPRPVARLMTAVEDFILRHSTWVGTISEGMRGVLLDRGVDPSRIELFPNWIDVRHYEQGGTPGAFRSRRIDLDSNFLVAYSGNFGRKQALDVIVDAAVASGIESGIRFLMIGDGADRPRLQSVIHDKQPDNLLLLPFLDSSGYLDMLEDVDVCVIPQMAGAGEAFFPSKLLGIMAKGVPVVVSADRDSMLSRFVETNECGIACDPEDGQELLSAVTRLRDDPALRQRLSEGGRRAVEEFSRETVLRRFLDRIVERGKPGSSPQKST